MENLKKIKKKFFDFNRPSRTEITTKWVFYDRMSSLCSKKIFFLKFGLFSLCNHRETSVFLPKKNLIPNGIPLGFFKKNSDGSNEQTVFYKKYPFFADSECIHFFFLNALQNFVFLCRVELYAEYQNIMLFYKIKSFQFVENFITILKLLRHRLKNIYKSGNPSDNSQYI